MIARFAQSWFSIICTLQKIGYRLMTPRSAAICFPFCSKCLLQRLDMIFNILKRFLTFPFDFMSENGCDKGLSATISAFWAISGQW
jgi:hypothetical protein